MMVWIFRDHVGCGNFLTNFNMGSGSINIIIITVVAFPCYNIFLENPDGIVSQILIRHGAGRCYCYGCIGRCGPTCTFPFYFWIRIGAVNQRHRNRGSESYRTARVTVCKLTAIGVPSELVLVHLPNGVVSQIVVGHCFGNSLCCCGIVCCCPTFKCVTFTFWIIRFDNRSTKVK